MAEIIRPLPPQLKCRLSVKSGEPLTPCRDKVLGHDFTLLVADGYDVLLGHIKCVFDTTSGLTWKDSVVVYVKPTNDAPQKDYIQVATGSTAIDAQFTAIWHKARLRKHGHAAFVLMLCVYVSRPKAQCLTSLRRATDSRIQKQLPRVAAHMPEHIIEGGPASQLYETISQARLTDDTPVQVPDNATMRQLRYIDDEERAMEQDLGEQPRRCDGEYRLVRVRIYGTPVPMYLNVIDLREALGLPAYSLQPPHRASLQLETADPAVDIADIDHEGDTQQ